MRIFSFPAGYVALALSCSVAFAAVQAKTDAPNPAMEKLMREIWPNLPPNQDPAAVARGKLLFSANCIFCHGAEATGGNGGPDLVRSVLVNHDEHGDSIGPILHGARANKGMPKFNFPDAQMADIVAFLHQRNRDARLRFTYKIADVAVGDSVAGKQYFNSRCGECHLPSGDLAHVGSKYPGDLLQQLWLDPAGAGQHSPSSQVTVTLPSGQTFSGKLHHLNEFNVSLYDSDGVYHSFPITPGTKTSVKDPLAKHQELLKQLTDKDMHNVTTYLETLQ